MVGPVPHIYGGISKVAGTYLQSPDPDMKISYVALSTKRPLIYKTALFFSGLFRIFFKLLFQRPDIVHLHFSKGASIYRKWVVQKMGVFFKVPVVVQSHTFLPEIDIKRPQGQKIDFYKRGSWMGKKVAGLFLDRADAVLVLSERIKLCFQKITSNKNIRVLPNPVNCQKYRFEEPEREGRRVLFMGDSSQRKGVRVLVKAASEVIRERPEVKFILCGGGKEQIQELAEEWGVENHVEVTGFVSGKKKQAYFKNADLFVLPSFREGLPVSMLEAMASELPVAAAPVGGIPDVLKEFQNGVFFNPGDYKGLAEQILFLLENRDVRKKIGKNNWKKALDEFDTPVVLRSLKKIYQDVIQNRHGKS